MSLSPTTLVKVKSLDVCTPGGRQLFQDLNVEISHDQVAMIGRNGVGKTTLLKILAGEVDRHEVVLSTVPYFVPQELGPTSGTISLARKWFNGGELADAGLSSDLLLQDACCLLYTSPSPRDQRGSRMPSSA